MWQCVILSRFLVSIASLFTYLFIFLSQRPAGPTFSLADVCVENPVVGLLLGHCARQQWALVVTLVCEAVSAKVANLLTVLK